MLVEVKVPTVGESITEGLLAEWLQPDGAAVVADDPLFVLETDKVTMTIPAEHAGRLAITVPAGSPVKIGQAVGSIDTEAKVGAEARPEAQALAAPPAPAVPQTPGPPLNPVAGVPSLRENLARPGATDALTPAVRRLVEEHRLDPAALRGTGRDGRLTKADVLTFLASGTPESAPPPAAPPASPEAAPETQTRRPLSPIRSRIAERMILSQQTTATLTTFAECDCGAILTLRKAHKEAFKARHGVDLGFMGFFVRAVAGALTAFPVLNGWIEGGEIVENREIHIGIAVAAEQGLAVPVLRNADRLSLVGIESEIARLAARVREKKVTLAELSGGTFSITNAGSYGAFMGTPILNPPQSGILGMYAIQERPVVREGQIVVRPVMVLALSYDHRLVDGKTAGLFLKHVADFVGRADASLLDL
jgi:2-oxoglutarate dehydrogenase E2 component (dihydrolipoamide succinyltransferase)